MQTHTVRPPLPSRPPMTPPNRPSLPAPLAAVPMIERMLDLIDDFVGVHRAVLDADGDIVDARLVWWNASYRNLRLHPVTAGQSMRAHYFDPDDAISHLRRAWENGRHEQLFVLDESSAHKYRPGGQAVHLLVEWLRIDDLIIEVCRDRSELQALTADIAEHRSTIRQAIRENAQMAERAANMQGVHDEMIRRLGGAALDLRTDRADSAAVAETIDEVMDALRRYTTR
ncbi:MAG: hypothetical protein RIR49_505 [Actinomycetota bacterium]